MLHNIKKEITNLFTNTHKDQIKHKYIDDCENGIKQAYPDYPSNLPVDNQFADIKFKFTNFVDKNC